VKLKTASAKVTELSARFLASVTAFECFFAFAFCLIAFFDTEKKQPRKAIKHRIKSRLSTGML
jgi:hypothetical protein